MNYILKIRTSGNHTSGDRTSGQRYTGNKVYVVQSLGPMSGSE